MKKNGKLFEKSLKFEVKFLLRKRIRVFGKCLESRMMKRMFETQLAGGRQRYRKSVSVNKWKGGVFGQSQVDTVEIRRESFVGGVLL